MLDPTAPGSAIADFVKSIRPNAGDPITDTQLSQMWVGIVKILYADIVANAVVAPGILVTTPTGPGTTSGPGKIE